MQIRLNKFLAECGLGSRRKCDEIITSGRVVINDKKITKLGTKVEVGVDQILVDDELIKRQKKTYYLVNKPKGWVCSNSKNDGAPRVIDLLPYSTQRIYTIGRLDKGSTGLVIVSNDGEFCNQLTHPFFHISKTYQVSLKGYLPGEISKKIQKGVWLSDGKTQGSRFKIIRRNNKETILEITIFEGKNRIIRRIFAKFGLKVKALCRVAIGDLYLGKLKPGSVKRVELAFLEKKIYSN